MKKLRKVSLLLSILTAFSGLAVGCGEGKDNQTDSCTHEYTWYIVENATCAKEGKLEGICQHCGEKTYQKLVSPAHDYENGFCEVCGAPEDGELISNKKIGWSLSDLYDRSRVLGFVVEKEEFLAECNNLILSDWAMSDSGVLSGDLLKYGETYSANLLGLRQDFTVKTGETGNIKAIEISYSRLIVTTTDGTRKDYGFLQELSANTGSRTISRIAINKQNEVGIIYDNNMGVRVGKLPSVAADAADSVLIYAEIPYSANYYIYSAMDKRVETLVVPSTHRGLPVTVIGSAAFKDCSALKKVIVPASVKTIYSSAFLSGVTLFYEGEELSNYDSLTASGITVYLAGEWELINGEPAPVV